jgi:hypothetical protein
MTRKEPPLDNILYQITHPWHWLAYGQNASAVAAVMAIGGLFGLYKYTQYTKTMMLIQESAARASILPLLVTDGDINLVPVTKMAEIAPGVTQPTINGYTLVFKVRNIGQGTAIFVRAWCQSVSDHFVGDSTILRPTQDAKSSNDFQHLQPSQTAQIFIGDLPPGLADGRRIIVVEAIDTISIPHQLQIIQTPLSPGNVQTEISMVHAKPSEYRKYLKRAQKG